MFYTSGKAFRADEFDLWPRHMRVPAHLRPLALAFGPLGMAAGLIGTVISAAGSAAAGQNAQALGAYEAAQHAEDAKTDVAIGQRKMLEDQYKGRFLASTLQARSAGAGLNPSVGSTNILGQGIAGRTTYDALSDLSAGQDRATTQTNLGAAAKYQGDLAESQVPLEIAGSVASGAGSFFNQGAKLNYWG